MKNRQESENIEFKKSTSELKEAVISIAAILNKHQKGSLIFGIKSDGKVVGQTVSESTLRKVSKTISEQIEPQIFPVVKKKIISEKDCIVVEFEGDEIPYFAYGRGYIRVADEDRKISPTELKKLILDNNKGYWEKQISEISLKDINETVLFEYVKKANDENRINFKFVSTEKTLNKLELIRNGNLLKAAQILFCDQNSLEVQAAVFAGKNKLTFLDIKQIKGNIFNLLESSETYIKEHIDWSVKFGKMEREEIPEIPIYAIREALINSLCHRDYNNPKGNEIAIYKDKMEIYNPGTFPEGYEPDDFIKGYEKSILRNPLIANVLYLRKDIEKWGSGLKRINDECA